MPAWLLPIQTAGISAWGKTKSKPVVLTNIMTPHKLSTIPHAACLGPHTKPRIVNVFWCSEGEKNQTSRTSRKTFVTLVSGDSPETGSSGGFSFAPPPYKWNVVNSVVTSLLAPKSDFRSEWNAPWAQWLRILAEHGSQPAFMKTLKHRHIMTWLKLI